MTKHRSLEERQKALDAKQKLLAARIEAKKAAQKVKDLRKAK